MAGVACCTVVHSLCVFSAVFASRLKGLQTGLFRDSFVKNEKKKKKKKKKKKTKKKKQKTQKKKKKKKQKKKKTKTKTKKKTKKKKATHPPYTP